MLKLLRSSPVLSILFLLIHSTGASAQDEVRAFKFSGEGKYIGFPDPGIEKGKQVRVQLPGNKKDGKETWLTYSFHEAADGYTDDTANAHNTMTLPDTVIMSVNKQLAARIEIALDNLSDSVRLQEFYEAFWGKEQYNKVDSDAVKLDSILKDPSAFGHLHDAIASFPEFDELNNLEDELKKPYQPYKIGVKFNPDSSRYEVNVFKTNRFQSLLLSYWTHTLGNMHYGSLKKINRSYKEQWEQIGPIAVRAKYWYDTLQKFSKPTCNPPDLTSLLSAVDVFMRDTLSLLDHNEVVQAVLNNSFCYQSTFWWNYGYFSFNPLGFSTAERTWHVFQVDKEAAALHDRIAKKKLDDAAFCCSLSINGVDSLIMERSKGAKIFSTDTTVVDPVWGLNDLHALRTTQKLVNQFEVPVTLKASRPQYYLQYDGARNFYADPYNVRYRRMSAADSLSFIIHNIGANTALVLNQVSQPTTNTSSFQDAVASLSTVSGLNTAASAVGLGALMPPASGAYLSGPAPFPRLAGANEARVDNFGTNALKVNIIIGQPPAVIPKKFPPDIWVTDSMDSYTLFKEYMTAVGKPIDENVMGHYFFNCTTIVYMHDYLHTKTPKQTVINFLANLIDSFNRFAIPIANLNSAVQALTQYGDIAYLSMITDRSLPPPPDSLATLSDSFPAYRTQIFPVPVYDSTRAVQATIVAKKIVKKDTTTITHPIYQSVRIGTLSRFAFSAGIAVTPGFYYEKTATSAGGQLTVTNNSELVGYMVGLHIYPWRYFPLDNSFLGFKTHHFKQRLSVYTGVALPNPLQDYYGGVGFDLVPGFKLVTGAHLYLNTRYQLENNQIASQASALKYGGTFVAFCIDPSAFVTVLGLFK